MFMLFATEETPLRGSMLICRNAGRHALDGPPVGFSRGTAIRSQISDGGVQALSHALHHGRRVITQSKPGDLFVVKNIGWLRWRRTANHAGRHQRHEPQSNSQGDRSDRIQLLAPKLNESRGLDGHPLCCSRRIAAFCSRIVQHKFNTAILSRLAAIEISLLRVPASPRFTSGQVLAPLVPPTPRSRRREETLIEKNESCALDCYSGVQTRQKSAVPFTPSISPVSSGTPARGTGSPRCSPRAAGASPA